MIHSSRAQVAARPRPARPPGPAGPWIAAALLLGAPVALLGLIVRDGPVLFDAPVRRALLAIAGRPGALLQTLDRVTSVPFWTALVLAVGLAFWLAGARRSALVLVAADCSAEIVTLALKFAIDRRAFPGAAGAIADALYPSGHVVRAVVALVVVIALLPLTRLARLAASLGGAAFALTVGVERVTAGFHLPTDVLGALLLGGAWASLSLATVDAVTMALVAVPMEPAPRRVERASVPSPRRSVPRARGQGHVEPG